MYVCTVYLKWTPLNICNFYYDSIHEGETLQFLRVWLWSYHTHIHHIEFLFTKEIWIHLLEIWTVSFDQEQSLSIRNYNCDSYVCVCDIIPKQHVWKIIIELITIIHICWASNNKTQNTLTLTHSQSHVDKISNIFGVGKKEYQRMVRYALFLSNEISCIILCELDEFQYNIRKFSLCVGMNYKHMNSTFFPHTFPCISIHLISSSKCLFWKQKSNSKKQIDPSFVSFNMHWFQYPGKKKLRHSFIALHMFWALIQFK